MEPENRAGHKGTFWQGRIKRLWAVVRNAAWKRHCALMRSDKTDKVKDKNKKIWQESILKVLAEAPLCHGHTSKSSQAYLNWPGDLMSAEWAIRCSPLCCWRPENQWHLTTSKNKGLQVSTLGGIMWGCLEREQRGRVHFSWMKNKSAIWTGSDFQIYSPVQKS